MSDRYINFFTLKSKVISTTLRIMVTSYNKTRLLRVFVYVKKNKWHHWIPGDILHPETCLSFPKLKMSKFELS